LLGVTSQPSARRTLTRLLAALGVASGLALLAAPERVVGTVAPEFPPERLWLARVLGARLVAQHGAVLATADPRLVRLGSAVDLAHAATMVPLLASPRYGRAARVSGGLAAAYAAFGALAAPGASARG
jgi:hypothetical protein